MLPSRRLWWMSILLVALAHAAGPEPAGEGRLGFRATVEGTEFVTEARVFTVQPRLDDSGRPVGFDVAVEVRGLDSGEADRDREMLGSGWLDAGRYPHILFRSRRVERTAAGYRALGALDIKGVVQDVAVPFTWYHADDTLRMHGEVELDRRRFGVGPADTSSVAAGVTVFFDLSWRWRR